LLAVAREAHAPVAAGHAAPLGSARPANCSTKVSADLVEAHRFASPNLFARLRDCLTLLAGLGLVVDWGVIEQLIQRVTLAMAIQQLERLGGFGLRVPQSLL
jgi:hypothetical protein